MIKEKILCFPSTLEPETGYKRRNISLKVGINLNHNKDSKKCARRCAPFILSIIL